MNRLPVAIGHLLILTFSTAALTQAAIKSPSMAAPVAFTLPLQQTAAVRILSGVVLSEKDELVPNVTVVIRTAAGEQRTTTDAEGGFRVTVPNGPVTLRFEGKNIIPLERMLSAGEATGNLQIKITLTPTPIAESVVIDAKVLDPTIDRRNDIIYKDTLFQRDDQLVQTLNAGINVGQHEGGGKSLEFRRFGYNLDHGGVNGGVKILVDDIQQNQASQGHGQGYLGQLKSLIPELVDTVEILNGPFSPQYGDFSGLGVVRIHLKESLPDQLTMRFQGGSFDERRAFLAYSPQLKNGDSFIAYEKSYLDGPFINKGRYGRDNITGNYTRHIDEHQSFSFKFNFGRNDFYSSGQIPLDLVATGELDRFGFIDPSNGGRVRTFIFGAYYGKDWQGGSSLKLDAFMTRSRFDLFSNFTFFLNDLVHGDGIQQHDSRLQEGGDVQFIHPYQLFGRQMTFIAGGNIMDSQIKLGLYHQENRVAFLTSTLAHVRITNIGQYIQQEMDFIHGRLHIDLGLRFDYFQFTVADMILPSASGSKGAGRIQPKVNIAYTPSDRLPLTIYVNYGRGINTQDARGIVRGGVIDPATPNQPTPVQTSGQGVGPPVATTDFYQAGAAYNVKRFSFSTDLFLIDHSNEQVYIPDDGSIAFAGPSRASGYEFKTSVQITRALALNGGLTQVMNAFYLGTRPRVYTDSAPHTVGNAGLALADFHGFSGSLEYRHVGNYRLDGLNAGIRASGLDVVDLSVKKTLRRWVDFNFSVDNLFNKKYFETQNYFESRVRPTASPAFRIHGTPGYPVGATAGLTFHLFRKGT